MMYVFDFEVFKYDWIGVFLCTKTNKYTVIHNDPDVLSEFMAREPFLIGFNNKWYDNHIIKTIITGGDPKQTSDYIIGGGSGYNINFPYTKWFYTADIFDDVQQGLSLKAIEGHLGLPIVESSIDFNIDRPLTEAELAETIKYCKTDVENTKKLVDLRMDYLRAKSKLARMKGIPEKQGLFYTNARLAAVFLGAEMKEWNDERKYVIPDNIDTTLIPEEVLKFFLNIQDTTITDEELFSSKVSLDIGGVPTQYGFGGLHGSLSQYYEETTENRVIQLRDVGSMYPTIMLKYGYHSRNIPSFDTYKDVYNTRMEAKTTGDKETDNTLKLILNTKFGAMGNKYNNLYDPLMMRSVCITGQLLLTTLFMELSQNCHTLRLLNLNTDGIMYSVDKYELPIVERICKKWEESSKLHLDNININRVWLKDVNNLMFVEENGKVTTAGGYLNYGMSMKGAWNINNNFVVVKKALENYLLHDIPPSETVNNDNNILNFQIIAKASGKYSDVYHIVGTEKVPVQKCNRVYASLDGNNGTLYKTHKITGRDAKIAGLPESCVVDNHNELDISQIDKDWYISLAEKYIDDYVGNHQQLTF